MLLECRIEESAEPSTSLAILQSSAASSLHIFMKILPLV